MTSTDQLLARYHEQGFVILRDVLDASEVEALRSALQPYLDLDLRGRNNFEGERTQRVYSLPARLPSRCTSTTRSTRSRGPVPP